MRTVHDNSRLVLVLCGSGALLAALGCEPLDRVDGTRGELGRVDFKYQRSCLFGCPLEQPLLAGTHEQIELSAAGDEPGIEPHSLAPDVAEFALERDCSCERGAGEAKIAVAEDASCEAPFHKKCDNHVLVEARAAGVAELQLRDAAGDVVDRATVTVANAARARFRATLPTRLGKQEGDQFEIAAGQAAQLELTLYDRRGFELLAPNHVRWHVEDDAIASVSAWLIGGGREVDAGLNVQVDAHAEGETKLAVDVPGLQTEVSLRVLP